MAVTIAEVPVKYTADEEEKEVNGDSIHTRTLQGTHVYLYNDAKTRF